MFLFEFLLPSPLVQLTGFVGLFILFYVFWRPRSSGFHKPFAADSRRPREALEHDQKKRALRLKQSKHHFPHPFLLLTFLIRILAECYP